MPKLPAFGSWLLTFVFVNCAFIFFRSNSVHDAVHDDAFVSKSASFFWWRDAEWGLGGHDWKSAGRRYSLEHRLAFYGKSSDQLAREFEPKYWNSFAVATMMVLCWLSLIFNTTQEFVYFKF